MFSMTRSAALSAACGVLMVTGFAQVASATYIIGPDGFDVPPYTLNASVVGQQGWQGQAGTAAPIQDTGDAGHGTAIFIDNSSVGKVYKTIPGPYNTDTTQIMRVKYDIYGTMASSTFSMPSVEIGDYWVSGYPAVYIEGMGPAAGVVTNSFRLNGDSSKLLSGINSQEHVWYSVTVDLSLAHKTYDVSITDGTNTGTATDVPFWYNQVPALNDVTFRTADYGGQYPNDSGYIDNFSVQMVPVPEPASLSLLGLGGLLLIRRRRAV
jgi:hypothetical protein